jgi:hypothetical protein
LLEDEAGIEEADVIRDLAARLISWVAITIVMPPAASSRIVFSTSPTSSGSRALVTSSKSIRDGRIASARTIATRCS